MDVNSIEMEDGDLMRPIVDAPSIVEVSKQKVDGTVKKRRRRGKSKRKIMKPFSKLSWQERKNYDKTKRNNRFRKIVLAKTQAPFNNNQFLMEIHKPEPENNFHLARTPSARTRDSSFSVDSEDNCFYSLPDDEEEYLTKEFSSVYEDAQSERLSNMSKDDLIQEYLLLEAKYDNLVKRTERKPRHMEDDRDMIAAEKEKLTTDKDSMLITDRDTSGTIESSVSEDPSICDIVQRMKEQEDQIRELQLANEKLKLENDHLRQRSHDSSSEDSESDSSSTSGSSSSSNRSMIPVDVLPTQINGDSPIENNVTNEQNGDTDNLLANGSTYPLANGFHSPSDQA